MCHGDPRDALDRRHPLGTLYPKDQRKAVVGFRILSRISARKWRMEIVLEDDQVYRREILRA